jgi:hypothetical protein
MPPKGDKGKVAKSTEAEKLAKLRRRFAIFEPTLDAPTLKRQFQRMWVTKTRAHPATRVQPAYAPSGPNKYPFFASYFYCGLCPPFSDFFIDIMYSFRLNLLDFTLNEVTTMAVFAHLCENFAGVMPSAALFRHYFVPRVEKGETLSTGIAWVSKPGTKETYPGGE